MVLKRTEGVTMSIGVASLKLCHAVNPDQLVNHADQALYKSKAHGRNRTSVAEVPQALTPASHAPAALAAAGHTN